MSFYNVGDKVAVYGKGPVFTIKGIDYDWQRWWLRNDESGEYVTLTSAQFMAYRAPEPVWVSGVTYRHDTYNKTVIKVADVDKDGRALYWFVMPEGQSPAGGVYGGVIEHAHRAYYSVVEEDPEEDDDFVDWDDDDSDYYSIGACETHDYED